MRVAGRSAYRRTRRAAVLVSTGLLTVTALTSATTRPSGALPGRVAQAAPAAFSPGTGSAIAIAYKVNPVFGNLSFGITAGESVAGHQNTGAQAQSKAINLGVIGVTLAGEGCKGAEPTLPADRQPQPVIVGSTDPGAEQGRTATLGEAIRQSARATPAPFSEAITTVAPLGDASLAEISGGISRATSGIVAPGVREARAISEIAELRLLDGLVVIQGMRWEAVQRSGGETLDSGTFSLGSLVVSGQSIPLPSDSTQQLNLLQDTLRAVGLTVQPPVTRVEQGIVFVDPFTIGVVPSALRDGLLGNVLTALAPVREALVAALFDLGCDGSNNILGNNAATAVTLLDLALASVTGAGFLTLELGGVQATTAEITGFGGLGVGGGLPALPSIGGLPEIDLPGSGPSFSPTTPGGTGGAGATAGLDESAAAPIAEVDEDGARGGALLAIALGGLLLLLATAEADRRKMRRAQRDLFLEN